MPFLNWKEKRPTSPSVAYLTVSAGMSSKGRSASNADAPMFEEALADKAQHEMPEGAQAVRAK